MATFILAIFLHISAGYAWYLAPKTKIIDIPVRAINIRLGDSDIEREQIQDDTEIPDPELTTSKQVEDAMTKLIRNNQPEKAVKKSPPPQAPKSHDPVERQEEKQSPLLDVDAPRQFVRFTTKQNIQEQTLGSALGNTEDKTADIKARYEQMISLWIQKFKLYPDSAREKGLQGKTVVRIRIDRRGNIRYSALEDTTGSEELDRAALDMVRRANPVPAVPENYVAGELFEFLIPVKFQIQ